MGNDDAEVIRLLAETADRLFDRHVAPVPVTAGTSSGWPHDLWEQVERADLPLVGVPIELGGAGGSVVHAAEVVRLAARHAAPIPLAETGLLAGWLLSETSHAVPSGPLTAAAAAFPGRGKVVCTNVPYARNARAIVMVIDHRPANLLALVDPRACQISPGANLAGEPRDHVVVGQDVLDTAYPVQKDLAGLLMLRGALARSVQIAGALEAVLALTVDHVRDRVQFGRALGQLSPVRERVAVLAEECQVTRAATDAAVTAWKRGRAAQVEFAVAAAKVRAGEAAGRAARIAHQLHGAFGMTLEADLHRFSTRLWSWRDEFGDERHWALRIGQTVARLGGARAWEMLTHIEPEDGDVNT